MSLDKHLPHGTDPALRKSIQIRTPRRKSQWPYTTGSQDIEERGAELRIAIMEKVPLAAEKPGTFVGGVASHLKCNAGYVLGRAAALPVHDQRRKAR